jgi:four helix bundle protein
VLRWVRQLPKDWATQVIAKQLLRAVTSVGANTEEADGTESTKDKVYKWALARKEARESRYWIRLLLKDGADSTEGQELNQECSELINILSAMINKGKREL